MPIVRKLGRCVCLTLLILLLALNHTMAAEISGRVVGITDGDTLTVLVDREQSKVRLAKIDTPESEQPYASRARQALSNLAFGKAVRVVGQGHRPMRPDTRADGSYWVPGWWLWRG
jgi:endonuclease YncB( thermonuclease family)